MTKILSNFLLLRCLKSIIYNGFAELRITMISAFDIRLSRWYLRFPTALNVYFAICVASTFFVVNKLVSLGKDELYS